MAGSPGNRPSRDQVLAKRTKALELRRDGWTLEAIAAHPWQGGRLYANKQNAGRAIRDALDAREAEEVDQYRQLHTVRLESLLRAAMPLAIGREIPPAILQTLAEVEGIPDHFLEWLREVRVPSVEHLREARMILADLARLWGLNAPTQVTIGGDQVDQEIQRLMVAMQQADDTWDVTGVPEVEHRELGAGGGTLEP